MTKRQKKLGVTAYGIEQVNNGNFMRDNESFMAWISTIRKGQYSGRNICKKMYQEISAKIGFEVVFTEYDFRDFQTMLRGVAYNYPHNFYYTDTYGLDTLTIL